MSENTDIKTVDPAFAEKVMTGFRDFPFSKLIGMELTSMTYGEATIEIGVRPDLRQPHGVLHGGITATIIDTAMAFAVISVLDRSEKASTVDLNVHYLRPASEGKVSCTAKIVRAGKRLLTVSAEAFSADGKMIATALSTYSKV